MDNLLTDEEIVNVILSDKNRYSGWTINATPRDRHIAKAQHQKDIEWLEGICSHIPSSFPNQYQPRRTCPECWKEFKEL